MDKVKFAMLISFIQSCADRRLEGNEIAHICDAIDEAISKTSTIVKHEPATHQQVYEMSSNYVKEFIKALQLGHKIEAIKAYRMLTGDGLLEAKRTVESLSK